MSSITQILPGVNGDCIKKHHPSDTKIPSDELSGISSIAEIIVFDDPQISLVQQIVHSHLRICACTSGGAPADDIGVWYGMVRCGFTAIGLS